MQGEQTLVDHRPSYCLDIVSFNTAGPWLMRISVVTPIYSRSLERKNLQAFCLLQILNYIVKNQEKPHFYDFAIS